MATGKTSMGWNGYRVDLQYSSGLLGTQIALLNIQPPTGYKLIRDIPSPPVVTEHLTEHKGKLVKIRTLVQSNGETSCEVLSIRELIDD